jgi:dynactin complex subunit
VYLVDEEAVVDFVKSLREIHYEHVRLKAFLELLDEIVDKLDQLCLTGSVPPETVL